MEIQYELIHPAQKKPVGDLGSTSADVDDAT